MGLSKALGTSVLRFPFGAWLFGKGAAAGPFFGLLQIERRPASGAGLAKWPRVVNQKREYGFRDLVED
jgi:hypothetical protein